MARAAWRWLSVVFLAGAGAVLLLLTAVLNAAFAFGSGTALIMSGTGNPVPSSGYVTGVANTYIDPPLPVVPGQLVFPGYTPLGLTTPEQFWPVTPDLGPMTFGQSVDQGVEILHNAITQTYAGEDLAIFGYSQSAAVATIEMRALAASDDAPDPSRLGFVLIGNPNNPDGGILERFVGLYIPILDVLFNGATPSDTPYETAIYSVQYDGIADFPQFALNPVATLNALMGYFFVHGAYPLTPEGLSVAEQLAVSPDYVANGGLTDYHMILTQNLPLLEPLRQIPVVGTFLAELLQPSLRVLVDLGYGDGFADVATPAGLFSLFNPFTVGEQLLRGVVQGWEAALVGAGVLPESALPNLYPYLPSPDPLLATSLWNLLTDNSQLGWSGLLGFDPVGPGLAPETWLPDAVDSVA